MFTILHFDCPVLESWLQEHPVIYAASDNSDEEKVYSSLNELLAAIAKLIDFDGNGIELIEDKGIVDNLIYILGGGGGEDEDEEESDENLVQLIDFLKSHQQQIEAEGSGELICATKFEVDWPIIESMTHRCGKSRYTLLDLNDVDIDEEDKEVLWEINTYSQDLKLLSSWTEKTVHDAIGKYAPEAETPTPGCE